MHKGSSVFRTSSFSQASQDESVVCHFVRSEGGENEIISSAGNTPDINNIASYEGDRLEGKLVATLLMLTPLCVL